MKDAVRELIVEEAVNVMKLYTQGAQDSIVAGLYGPREARFAALIMFLAHEHELTATARQSMAHVVADYEKRAKTFAEATDRRITKLDVQLNELLDLVEHHVGGGAEIVADIRKKLRKV